MSNVSVLRTNPNDLSPILGGDADELTVRVAKVLSEGEKYEVRTLATSHGELRLLVSAKLSAYEVLLRYITPPSIDEDGGD